MADNALGIAAPEGRPSSGRFDPSENAVQRTRAWTGLLVVIAGDALIGGAAAFGVFKGGDATSAQSVAILSSAFTAISTMTAAYFGIRAVTNTAQSAVAQQAATTMATAASAAAGPTGGGPRHRGRRRARRSRAEARPAGGRAGRRHAGRPVRADQRDRQRPPGHDRGGGSQPPRGRIRPRRSSRDLWRAQRR